jgi:ureidoglycolate lyase
MPRTLVPQPLTVEAFAPFGDVIEAGSSAETINRGTTQYFPDLARVDVTPESGRPRVSLYRVTPYRLPMSIAMLERHPLGSQMFMPLRGARFVVVVAPRGDRIDPANVSAFVTNGSQGVNYHPGTWHHPVIALSAGSEFLVIDREGPGANCDEHPFTPDALLLQAPVT